ncbi:MAG: hypothetical protein P1U85_21880 [Verrucomicrobiales bacterium]|nr:hypothetical protein [Verrucomicrobiales bacterium]
MNKYRSKYEANIAKDLKARRIKFEYETIKIPYYLSKKGRCKFCSSGVVFVHKVYTPDFIIGSLIIEAKGRFVSSDRTKMLAAKEANPSLDIRMLFMRDQWCTKKKRKRYSDWCNDHNIPFAFGTALPKSWLRESRK